MLLPACCACGSWYYIIIYYSIPSYINATLLPPDVEAALERVPAEETEPLARKHLELMICFPRAWQVAETSVSNLHSKS